MSGPHKTRRRFCLKLFVALLSVLSLPLFGENANSTGRFEVYCDGVGFFLKNVGGAPVPGNLVLFSHFGYPPGTMGGRLIGQGMWRDVVVYRGGCIPDGKCESIARGRVWIDMPDEPSEEMAPPKIISGKYEIELDAKHIEGRFALKQHHRKQPLRICM